MTFPTASYERRCTAFITGRKDAERGIPSRAAELENPALRQSYLQGLFYGAGHPIGQHKAIEGQSEEAEMQSQQEFENQMRRHAVRHTVRLAVRRVTVCLAIALLVIVAALIGG